MGLFIKNPTIDSTSPEVMGQIKWDMDDEQHRIRSIPFSPKILIIMWQTRTFIYFPTILNIPKRVILKGEFSDRGIKMAEEKSRVVYGILAILVGGLGIHKFYIGNVAHGIYYILLSCVGIGGILGLVSGILALLKSDEEFHQKYVVEQSFI